MPDDSLAAAVRAANPWWRGEREHDLPAMRRWVFEPILRHLRGGMTPAVVLRGPRPIGKSTLLAQVIDQLLDSGVEPHRILRVQFDELPGLRKIEQPILDMPRWFAERVLKKSFNQAARDGEQAFLFFDEVQNLADRAPQLKYLVETQPVRVLVTGSSALRIEAGRDSLAGRVFTFEMGPLLLREIAEMRRLGEVQPMLAQNGLAPLKTKEFWLDLRMHGRAHADIRDNAFRAFSARGAYPTAHAHLPRARRRTRGRLCADRR